MAYIETFFYTSPAFPEVCTFLPLLLIRFISQYTDNVIKLRFALSIAIFFFFTKVLQLCLCG